jgi:hypothetical protein
MSFDTQAKPKTFDLDDPAYRLKMLGKHEGDTLRYGAHAISVALQVAGELHTGLADDEASRGKLETHANVGGLVMTAQLAAAHLTRVTSELVDLIDEIEEGKQ